LPRKKTSSSGDHKRRPTPLDEENTQKISPAEKSSHVMREQVQYKRKKNHQLVRKMVN